MSAWGNQPWQTDVGSDAAADLLRGLEHELEGRLKALYQTIDLADSEAGAIDELVVYCDLLVRLAPYWRISKSTKYLEIVQTLLAEKALPRMHAMELPSEYARSLLDNARELLASGPRSGRVSLNS